MKNLLLFSAILLSSISINAQCSKDYHLIWSDEFDSTAVDTSIWQYQIGGSGWGNQEVQFYTDSNASVSNDILSIKIENDTIPQNEYSDKDMFYTSTRMITQGSLEVKYGKVESRIKMPTGLGFWPAFWMLGSNYKNVGWPHCGEIDIMEWVGRGADIASGSIFFDGTWPDNHVTTAYHIPDGQSFTDEFHTFAIEWEPNEIRWYCDDNLYQTLTAEDIAPKEWLFNNEFFILLNCAVGGTGGGNVIDAEFPQFMEIDYVRVYGMPETVDTLKLEGVSAVMANKQNVVYNTDYFQNATYVWSVPEGASIIDGDGTNAVQINFGNVSGDVKVSVTNSCTTLTDSISVLVVMDGCTIMYDDFDDSRLVNYNVTGEMEDSVLNFAPNAINSSEYVARYIRNDEELYDVFGIADVALVSALEYEASERVFFLDVYTNQPIGTNVTLQLENGRQNSNAYPLGRRSAFNAYTHKQNEWHTLRFGFDVVVSEQTVADQVNYIALLFHPAAMAGDTFYIDNLRSMTDAIDCDTLPFNEINSVNLTEHVHVYPNPTTGALNVVSDFQVQNIAIHDLTGRAALIETNTYNTINISDIENGVYFVIIQLNGGGEVIKRIIKQ